MRKNNTLLYLIVILFLAIGLRFFKLGQIPHGMAIDEAAIGYNGFAVFTVHRDEWLEKMPLSFRSFGDYKAPFAIYLNGLFTAVFGMNLWAVRLPFALFGVTAILGIFLLGKELFFKKNNCEQLALILAFLLAISPWHLHYSRVGFESGIAVSVLIWAIYFLKRYLREEKFWQLILATILAVGDLYIYHSSKLVVPLLVLTIIIINWQFFKKRLKKIWPIIFLSMVLAAPLLYDAVFKDGLARAGATIFSQGLGFFETIKLLITNFLAHFSLNFLVMGENNGQLRRSDGRFGVLAYPSLVLIFFYLLKIIKNTRKNNKQRNNQNLSLAIIWIILGIMPAAIGDHIYHPNRAILALPGFLILVSLAIDSLLESLKWQKKTALTVIVAAYLLFLVVYQKNYYQNYSKISANAFNDGYLEAFEYIKETDKSQIDKILFTNDYQHAYIYALFSFELSPIAYQGGILNIFEFNEKIDASDLKREKVIVVASESDEMGEEAPDKIIYGSDDSERFRIYLP